MKSRFAPFGVLIASVMGLLLTSTPAEATFIKNVTLVGNATLTSCDSGGLSYPVWTSGPNTTVEVPETNEEITADPKGVPEVNTTVKNGNTCGFSFTADCLKESVGKKNGVDSCVIVAVGRVTGFCGLFSGTATAVLINISNTVQPKPPVVTDFKLSSTGTTLRVSGGNTAQWIKGEVSVNPNTSSVGVPGCTNKTATTFIIMGDVAIKHL